MSSAWALAWGGSWGKSWGEFNLADLVFGRRSSNQIQQDTIRASVAQHAMRLSTDVGSRQQVAQVASRHVDATAQRPVQASSARTDMASSATRAPQTHSTRGRNTQRTGRRHY